MRPASDRRFHSLVTLLCASTALAQDPKAAPPAAEVQPGGKLVEGTKINPFTYTPKAIAGDAADPAQTDLRKALEAMGPVAIEWFQHVQTLSNPFFEGRVPGSRGNEMAGEYVQFWMRQAGLEPAFRS